MKVGPDSTLKKGRGKEKNADYFVGYEDGNSHPEFKDEQYFTRDAAMKEAKAQNKKIPSKEHYEKAAEACPGEYEQGDWCPAFKELYGLLGLKLSGCRRSDGSWHHAYDGGFSRSSSEYEAEGAQPMLFLKVKGRMYRHPKDDAFPVRALQD